MVSVSILTRLRTTWPLVPLLFVAAAALAVAACGGGSGSPGEGGLDDESLAGTVAAQNPWEFLHTVRFGHPASPMPSFDQLNESTTPAQTTAASAAAAADVGAHAATLPQ